MICNMCMNYPTIHFVNDAIFSSRAERYYHRPYDSKGAIKTLKLSTLTTLI